MKNRSEAYPIKDIVYKGIQFKFTDFWTLVDILDSIQEGTNIWLKSDWTPMREGVGIYNKELLPWTFVVAFDREEARDLQVEASKQLENIDTWKYTLPDITTLFEIEKDGKKLYCYVVDRMDMWKHQKPMLMWQRDDISIDGVIVYPTGVQNQITKTWEELLVENTRVVVDGIVQIKK